MEPDPINAIRDAIWHNPHDTSLRMQLVELLMERAWWREALTECLKVIGDDASNVDAFNALHTITAVLHAPKDDPVPTSVQRFDWTAAEADLRGITAAAPLRTLDDVAGMNDIKRKIEDSFLTPLRNPGFAKAYGVSPGGGLLLYGPPGCGKSLIASAIAGEIGATYFDIGINDILDSYLGASERNLHDIFEEARRRRPCVIVFNEVDVLGERNSGPFRNIVNQFLVEVEKTISNGNGVYVIGTTNMPWKIDHALRRPGRFGRMLFVAPPDAEARAAIVRARLDGKPISGIDVDGLVESTEGFSGADMVEICDAAAKSAMGDSLILGEARNITDDDIRIARSATTSTVGAWFESARPVVQFANSDGTFDDVAAYMNRPTPRKRRWRRGS